LREVYVTTAVGLIGCSAIHQDLMDRLAKFAATDAEILIVGPTGVGKELYAQYIHRQSPRAKAPFVPVNCGAIPDSLIENELFGHIGGAFTGARPQSEGLVAAAEGGTLFLDEIDTLSLPSQVKLLRFIQEREYRRLGEARTQRANVRFVAATNTDLLATVQAGRFRQDLFFRLRVIPIEVPALWKRPEDILPLIKEYIRHYARLYNLEPVLLSPGAVERLVAYSWPGNVRELENCMQYLTCLRLGQPVQSEDLPLLAVEEEPGRAAGSAGVSFQKAKAELVHGEFLNTAGIKHLRGPGTIAGNARLSCSCGPFHRHRLPACKARRTP
jgi:DNA-binding NtrC family response regulator